MNLHQQNENDDLTLSAPCGAEGVTSAEEPWGVVT